MEALPFLVSGCVFGLAGGFSPGPTTTVVVSQTLRFGVLEGIKVAIAPALAQSRGHNGTKNSNRGGIPAAEVRSTR